MDVRGLHISTAQYGLTVVGDHTARDGAERGGGGDDRQSEINGDGQKKVTTVGEAEWENVSVAEREKTGGWGRGRQTGIESDSAILSLCISTASRGVLENVGEEKMTQVRFRDRPAFRRYHYFIFFFPFFEFLLRGHCFSSFSFLKKIKAGHDCFCSGEEHTLMTIISWGLHQLGLFHQCELDTVLVLAPYGVFPPNINPKSWFTAGTKK